MITKDGRDTPIDKLTPGNYIVPRGEKKAYHVVIEVEQFDPKTGVRLSRPRLQKFGKKAFESRIAESLRKQGYKLTILHNPTDWMRAEQAESAERAKALAEAEKKAEQERFDAAVAAAVAKALAERDAKQAESAERAKAEAKKSGRKKDDKEKKQDDEQPQPGDDDR